MTITPTLRPPVAAPPIRRRGLHREIVETLGQAIVRGDYRPGQSLPNEADLGQDLNVSRTVVREAVKVLAAKGLVDPRPKTGTRVLDRSSWSLIDPDVLGWQVEVAADLGLFRDLSEVRAIIEPRAAELAAERRTDAEAVRLVDLGEMLDAVADDPDRYVSTDLELHGAILRATHNELLARMTGTIGVALAASRRITVRTSGGARAAMPSHLDVVHAIRDGRGADASAAMAAIISGAAGDIETVLRREARVDAR